MVTAHQAKSPTMPLDASDLETSQRLKLSTFSFHDIASTTHFQQADITLPFKEGKGRIRTVDHLIGKERSLYLHTRASTSLLCIKA